MTALKTPPEATIQQIQTLLTEGYGSGFTIFKELVQNADDVCAKRLLLAGHEGFAQADNVLLRAPGFFVANDGPVSSANWDALQLAAGGGKGGDSQAVGRFGLGQKALYHLCDAYPVFARLDGGTLPTTMILNPYEDIEDAEQARAWQTLSSCDEALLCDWADRVGMGQGLVLYIPLRTATLRPSNDPRMCLTHAHWTPREALKDMIDGAQLHAAIACLRHLEQIDIKCPGENDWRAEFKPGFARLAGPGNTAQAAMQPAFGGIFTANGRDANVYGAQRHAATGQAIALRAQEDWPSAWTLTGLEKAKATPHGAAVVCRHPARHGDTARLRIWQGVYLPLGDPAKDSVILGEAVLNGSDDIDVIVHGDFFVSSNRASILKADGNKGQNEVKIRWNEALEREAALPCVLDAVAQAVQAMPSNKDRYDLLRALGEGMWWRSKSGVICYGRALARLLNASGESWVIEQAARLRPIPESDATRPRRLAEAWKGFGSWCNTQGFVLAQGTTLGETRPQWSDREIAELVAGMAPAALAGKDEAQTLAVILDDCVRSQGALGPLALSAMADAFRAAMRDKAKMAPMLQIKLLTRHLPADQLVVLPKAVIEPDLLAHIAAETRSLCIRAEWLDDVQTPHARRLAKDEAVDLLAALEPLTARQGRIFDQTLTLIALVLEHGPSLEELANDGKAVSLKIIPVLRVSNEAAEMLSPSKVLSLMSEKLLFHHGPIDKVAKLAAAVVEPTIYQLRINASITPPKGYALASSNGPSDKVGVVGKVQRFGTVSARIALFGELRDHLPPPLLRRLIAGEANLRDTDALARIAGLSAALMPLVNKLIALDSTIRMIEPAISDKLSPEEAGKANVVDFDLAWLGNQLVRHRAVVELLEEEQAMALLASGLSKEVLRPLALHRVMGENGMHRPDTLLRGRLDAVPEAMRGLVRIVDPWPEAKAAACQSQLIDDWTPERQAAIALASAQPQRFCTEIQDAMGKIVRLDDALFTDLHQQPWLLVNEDGVAPKALRDLLPCALSAWDEAVMGPPPALRNALTDALLAQLDRHGLIDDRATSYRRVLRSMAANGTSGLVVDPIECHTDLARLAYARCDLAETAWPMLASTLRAFESEDALRPVLAGIVFAPPNTDAVIDQLNSLAVIAGRDGQVGEAARRLWRNGFGAHAAALRTATHFLPADLLVESDTGQFARADKLALVTTGVEPRDSLAGRWHFDLPSDHTPTVAGSGVRSVPIAEKVQDLFAPFRPFHELHSAVFMVLAMLGRGPAIRRVAEQFHGNPGFNDISADLDNASKRLHGLCDPLPAHMSQMRLAVVPLSAGQALVLSAAGTPMLAHAEHDGALLYGCIKAADAAHSWQLSMSPIEPRDLDHATRLLRDAAKKLVEPIGMRLQDQSNAVLAQFEGYLRSDQATLDELISDIKDGLAERIKKLTRGDYLKAALTRYDEDRKQGRHDNDETQSRQRAKENLWAAIKRPEAAGELLAAIREKMVRRNYAPERILFELFQNAVDAAHQKGETSDVRVEATRDETGAIRHLRLIHWGRPINVPGGPKTPSRYERDLDNMLDLDSSEKEGEDHGKHGLGFKTCHMLSEDTRVASGRLLLRIRGGMIPQPWEEGRELQQHYNTREAQATIIDLPIALGREADAGRAWEQFTKVAAFLPVTAPDISQVILVDGGGDGIPSGKAEVMPTSNQNIAHVCYGQDQNALLFNLGTKRRLYVKLLNGVPVPFSTDWSRLWNLAPLDGEDLKVAWLIDGDFEMDQGRRGLHGQAEDKRAAMRRLSMPLGERLVELFQDWDRISPALGLAPTGRDVFFARMIDHMITDKSDHLACELHGVVSGGDQIGAKRGLAELFDNCEVVPLASCVLVCAGQVKGVYRHTLTDKTVREKVDVWPERLGHHANAVEEQWAYRLEMLGFVTPRAIDLGTLAQDLFWGAEVDAHRAAALGAVFNSSARDGWHSEERERVDAALRTVKLRAESGDFVEPNRLWFPQDKRDSDEGKIERQRAAFMPHEARLHPDYQGDTLEFAQLARARAGYLSRIERQHLATAYLDPTRCLAALVYLADHPRQIAGLNWLAPVEVLRGRPGYESLTRQQRGTLELWLGGEDLTGPDNNSIGEEEIKRSAEEILHDVAVWWQENREELTVRHDRLTYGELGQLCSTDALQGGDDGAWFTMLSLGSFQTLGRITPQQSREFVQCGVEKEWWLDLAKIGGDDRELRPYVDRLLEWSDIGAREDYLLWRRCLGDMCLIARNLGTYREILLALPQMIAQLGNQVALSDLFRPSSSHIVGQMGLDAAPLAKSLGMGANWIVRELARRGVYDADQAALVQPYAWSARLRIRNFAQEIGLGDFKSGVEQGLLVHRAVCDKVGEDFLFGIDGDLPLELLNTRERNCGWLPARGQILNGTWSAADLKEVMNYA